MTGEKLTQIIWLCSISCAVKIMLELKLINYDVENVLNTNV